MIDLFVVALLFIALGGCIALMVALRDLQKRIEKMLIHLKKIEEEKE